MGLEEYTGNKDENKLSYNASQSVVPRDSNSMFKL